MKFAAEAHLQALNLDWVILRPSMVYSSAGSFGGSSLIRGLVALPLFIPLVGDGGHCRSQEAGIQDRAYRLETMTPHSAISRGTGRRSCGSRRQPWLPV